MHDQQTAPVDRFPVPLREIGEALPERDALVQPVTFEFRPRRRIVAVPGEQRAERGVRLAVGGFERDRLPGGVDRRRVVAEPFAHQRQRDERVDGRRSARRQTERRLAVGDGRRELSEFVVRASAVHVEHGVVRVERETDPASVDRRRMRAARITETRDVDVVERFPHITTAG